MRIQKINGNRLWLCRNNPCLKSILLKKAISKDKESLSNNIPKESEQIPREETKKKQVEYQKQLAARPIPKRVRYCPLRSGKARPKSQRITPLAVNPGQVFC